MSALLRRPLEGTGLMGYGCAEARLAELLEQIAHRLWIGEVTISPMCYIGEDEGGDAAIS